jgi:predicted nucleic acid-binding protein
MIVVDSNVLAARNLTGPQTLLAGQVEKCDPVWIVPPLWRYEFQNILAKAIWAQLITPDDAVTVWKKATAQLSENEHDPNPEKVLDLSTRHHITAYDANFIALAMEMGVSCVTEDRELLTKFPLIATSMEDFVKQGTADEVHETRALYRTRKINKKK